MYIQGSTIDDCGSYHNNLKLATLPYTHTVEAASRAAYAARELCNFSFPGRRTAAGRE